MNIFNFENYLEILNTWLKSQHKSGRGLALKLSQELNVSTVLVSQIFNGKRSLQEDYAYRIAKFMGLTSNEIDYFLLLVQFENAGTDAYKKHLQRKIAVIKNSSSEIKSRVSKDLEMSEEQKAKFYSHWHFSAVRLLTDIPGKNTISAISDYLNLSQEKVAEILVFLVECKMCIVENGKYKMAIRNTHLSSESPWIYSRQLQWRQKSLQSMETPNKSSFYYTGPMVLSRNDIAAIRELLVSTISKATECARKSSSEELMCLNIDWFSV